MADKCKVVVKQARGKKKEFERHIARAIKTNKQTKPFNRSDAGNQSGRAFGPLDEKGVRTTRK